ncbi:N-acetyltransferase [Aquimarina sp. 2304DJ70-9]|uniref:N-acetyltransferase n=1 Tax=Aquimarina penaris TaxID=3231044 RepID=UPI0034621D0A
MEIIPLILSNEGERSFFEFRINDQRAFIEFQMFNQRIMLLLSSGMTKHLLNAEEVLHALIERVLDHLRKSDCKVISYCPKINAFIKKNQRYGRVLQFNLN